MHPRLQSYQKQPRFLVPYTTTIVYGRICPRAIGTHADYASISRQPHRAGDGRPTRGYIRLFQAIGSVSLVIPRFHQLPTLM
jgi:hypothetical protein